MAVGAIASAAAVAPAINYIWVGNGPDNLWTTCANWLVNNEDPECFPSTPTDSAIFPAPLGGFDVEILDETIDDVIITGNVRFSAAGPGLPTLTADKLTIFGQTGGTVVSMQIGAVIETQ